MIVGPTMAGKTTLTLKILRNLDHLFDAANVPMDILYCYSVYQPLYHTMEMALPNMTLYEGLPTQAEIMQFADGVKSRILILSRYGPCIYD